jgi:hypothetical protein
MKKTTRQRIREEVKADQARYDEVTRELLERIERGRGKSQRSRRDSS